jgi:3-oxoacyl-[acyl-carrier-protein] synthase II
VKRRVVVTGIGALSPLGHTWAEVRPRLVAGETAVQVVPSLAVYQGTQTHLGAVVAPFTLDETRFSRKATRSMGKVAVMAVHTAEEALRQAGLLGEPVLKSGRVGVAYGSSSGSPPAIAEFARMYVEKKTEGLSATTYLRMMPHTAAVNIGVFFGLTGRVLPTPSACTSGSQAIGQAFECIQSGHQDVMVAGGAEEFDASQVAVFDTLFATSTRNEAPHLTPRPFDVARDGLVIGEGACTLVLESLEHAQARGASVVGEIVGYGTNSDGTHITNPNAATMAQAMRLALASASLPASAIGYVNAHGTATAQGDVAESRATNAVFGDAMPISSLKSYLGHTLGACGALECWLTLEMQKSEWVCGTANLTSVDPSCGVLDYVVGAGRSLKSEYMMTNNFAFGGINTSLVLRRW